MLNLINGDALTELRNLPSESVQCCVTSPPYWGLRDYGVEGQMGLETTPDEFVSKMTELFREVRRVLRNDGTLWLNIGDSYAANGQRSNNNGTGSSTMGWPGQSKETLNKAVGLKLPSVNHGLKPKDLCGIPWRLALSLQADGWYLRSDIIWHKPNPMPESVTDRPTKSHEYIFMLTKSERYFYDANAIKEPHTSEPSARRDSTTTRAYQNSAMKTGVAYNDAMRTTYGENGRNKRTVWTISTQPYAEAHFATFPEELPKLCILAGSKVGDTILDPFGGSGTTGKVALDLGRKATLIELNPAYCELIENRCNVTAGML